MAAKSATTARVRLVPKVVAEEPVYDFPHKALSTRREAEVFFEIDAAQAGESPAWKLFFVETMVEFLVFGSRPTGRVTEEDARWLLSIIGEDMSPSVPALIRAMIQQAEDIPSCLLKFAMTSGIMRSPASSLV